MLQTLRALAVIGTLVVLTSGQVRAEQAGAKDAQSIISAQIDAFQHDDGERAYSFAAPMIRMMFPRVDMFMDMVRQGYMPVYRPKQFQFSTFSIEDGVMHQQVDIVDAEGQAWIADYTLGASPDGTLKITGCRLQKRPGIGA
jgi:hypothetical protein